MKNKVVAGILSILLGWLGVHKFYMGNTKGGIIYIVISIVTACSIGSLLGLIEGIMILIETDEKFQERVEAKKIFF